MYRAQLLRTPPSPSPPLDFHSGFSFPFAIFYSIFYSIFSNKFEINSAIRVFFIILFNFFLFSYFYWNLFFFLEAFHCDFILLNFNFPFWFILMVIFRIFPRNSSHFCLFIPFVFSFFIFYFSFRKQRF